MQLDPDQCRRALVARDPRFDGLFFVGVASTGIYCRPVCPARTPRPEVCTWWRDAAEAEHHGFRACRRCRPERAPGHASVDARSRLIRRALTRLVPGAHPTVEALAAELGVSDRHLRRVFAEDLGVSPQEVLDSRRVALAAQLLAAGGSTVDEVATAAGWSSARAFRASFKARTGRTPSQARGPHAPRVPGLALVLDARPPFAFRELLRFLAARTFQGVERVDGDTWTRTARLGPHVGVVRATADERGVRVVLDRSLAPVTAQVLDRVRRVFDLDARPDRVHETLAADPHLAASIARHPGLRLPAAFDPFELAVRAVLGQQVSVAAATTLAGRLVAVFGVPLPAAVEGLDRLFPTPEALSADVEAVRAIGLPARRAATLVGLARAVLDEAVDLGPDADPERTMAQLRLVPGIGPWTAAYVAMRGLGWPDAFPTGDLGLAKALGVRDAAEAERLAERWRPWRAYAAMHLWQGE